MAKGKVKFFNNDKGFGFIINEADKKDIFVHASNLVDQIKENDEVSFDIEEGKKGLLATNVSLA